MGWHTSFGVVCMMGVIGVSVAGSYPGFTFLTEETRSYPPQPVFEAKASLSASVDSAKPVVRTQRGLFSHHHGHHDHHDHHDHHSHSHAYVVSPTVYVNKAPLYYPESAVFSDPLPVVQLPQLPAQFLTLKSADVNTGAYGGAENEVPKKSATKRGRKGKKQSPTTPAPEEDDAQETEGDEEQGGYPASGKTGQTEGEGGYPASGKSRQTEGEGQGGYPSSGRSRQAEADNQGGYPSSGRSSQTKASQRDYPSFRSGQTEADNQGGYPSSDSGSQTEADSQGGYPSSGSSSQTESNAQGGYPSSFDAPRASSGRSRSNSNSRGNRNRYESDENTAGETEADEEDEEIMMTGEDAEDDQDDNARDNAAEIDEEEQQQEEEPKRGKSGTKSKKRGGKKRGRGGSRSRGKGSDEDEISALNEALSNDGGKIDTFYVPTFGNNVLNTVYPAFSQNLLLRSLDAQTNNGYADSGQDVSAIMITNEDEMTSAKGRKKSRKSKKRTSSRRKNRPASRSRQGRRGGSKNRQNSDVRAQEPSEQYGAPLGRSEAASQQYGAPLQGRTGLSPPAPSGNFRMVNNEMRQRQRTSDAPSSEYGAPVGRSGALFGSSGGQGGSSSSQYGAPSPSSGGGRFLEPRQLSQATFVNPSNQDFSSDSAVTQELIRTVQAILEKYPN